jgi:hypothetical protein
MWFIIGICAGIFADRAYPVPVDFVVKQLQGLWAKVYKKSSSSPSGDA